MQAKFQATLEKSIEDWLHKMCEDFDSDGVYFDPNLAEQMARAAATVFDISFSAQQFYIQEESSL